MAVIAILAKRVPAVTSRYDWVLAINFIAFVFSAFGNGANDVANSYAPAIAARTLTMPQVGVLAACTEFVGAVALGSRVTDTIKNGIIDIGRFQDRPGVLMLAMGCAEVGSATWLMTATKFGWPVSTTQTIIGALIGVGFATSSPISWEWKKGSVSQVAASWFVAPLIACCFTALIFATLKFGILERKNPFEKAMRAIPFYVATTCAILALFIVVEAPTAPSLEEFGAGKASGIILGVWAGMLAVSYIFLLPYFKARLIKKDTRIKFYHVPLGPMLLKDDPPLYFPSKDNEYVTDYYEDPFGQEHNNNNTTTTTTNNPADNADATSSKTDTPDATGSKKMAVDSEKGIEAALDVPRQRRRPGPRQRFLDPVKELHITHPQRIWGYVKFVLLQGVTRDCVTHDSHKLREIHARAHKYDPRVEHLWIFCQVVSSILMSIAHGSNDVANAIGPVSASYATYRSGEVDTTSGTPVWLLVIAGLLLGAGFWFYGYHIIRSLGNKITQMSPTRGYSVSLGAAITVLLASRLGLPVSTTQCLVGSCMGVALMNLDARAVNWRQLGFIFLGWVMTLPCAGLISGLLCVMALNAPSF